MDDFKKYIRYLIPSFVVLIELGIFFAILFFNQIDAEIIRKTLHLSAGSAILLIVTSGGSGFIFNILNHHAIWMLPTCYPGINYQSFISHLQENKFVKILSRGETSHTVQQLENQWWFINLLWHRLKTEDEQLRAADARNNSLVDVAHSLGSILTGTILIIPFTIMVLYKLIKMEKIDSWTSIGIYPPIFAVTTLLLFLHIIWTGLKRSNRDVQFFVESNLLTSLSQYKKKKKGKPFTVNI